MSNLGAELSITRHIVANPLKAGSQMPATRRRPGFISFSNPSHLLPISGSNVLNPVILPPGVREILDEPGSDRIGNHNEYDWDSAGRTLQCR
jgi:hypothetical protein